MVMKNEMTMVNRVLLAKQEIIRVREVTTAALRKERPHPGGDSTSGLVYPQISFNCATASGVAVPSFWSAATDCSNTEL